MELVRSGFLATLIKVVFSLPMGVIILGRKLGGWFSRPLEALSNNVRRVLLVGLTKPM